MKKAILFILVFALAVYAAYLVAVPHYQYYAFKSDLNELVKVSIGRESEVMNDIIRIMEEYEIPIGKDDIYLTKENNRYVVRTSWQVTVDFFTIYQRTFKFDIDTSKTY